MIPAAGALLAEQAAAKGIETAKDLAAAATPTGSIGDFLTAGGGARTSRRCRGGGGGGSGRAQQDCRASEPDVMNYADTQDLNAYVTALRHLGRQEHFDADGGGRITRTIYCEPYTAHKRVVTALRGTVYNAGGSWARAKPHNDPLYPWFYCQDVQVEPAFPAAARASRPTEFDRTKTQLDKGLLNTQFSEIQRALSVLDDYDGTP